MPDNKKNEYKEQDMELSLNDLSGVSGGEDSTPARTAQEVEEDHSDVSPNATPGSFPDTTQVGGVIIRKIL